MAANTDRSVTSTIQTRRSGVNNLRNSSTYKFRVQSAPPLSIQQYLRSAVGVLPGNKEWQPSGKYRTPTFRGYLSPEVRAKPKKIEPVWHPPGQYRDKRPTSLDPEKKVEQPIVERVWHPPGKPQPKPVPYFDPPNLRWSLQNLLRSMPEMRPKTFHASRSMSTLRKSKEVQDI